MITKKLKLNAKNHSSKVKAFERYAAVLLFSFCGLCISVSLCYAETSSKQLPSGVDEKKTHLLFAKSPTTDISRQLWQVRITPPEEKKTNKSKNELYRMIEEIRSVKFEPMEKSAEPIIVVEPTRKVEAREISSDVARTGTRKNQT